MIKQITRWTLSTGFLAAMIPSLGCSNAVTMPSGSITNTEPMHQQMMRLPVPGASKPDMESIRGKYDTATGQQK